VDALALGAAQGVFCNVPHCAWPIIGGVLVLVDCDCEANLIACVVAPPFSLFSELLHLPCVLFAGLLKSKVEAGPCRVAGRL